MVPSSVRIQLGVLQLLQHCKCERSQFDVHARGRGWNRMLAPATVDESTCNQTIDGQVPLSKLVKKQLSACQSIVGSEENAAAAI